jgi:type IV secretion system protein VirB5
MGTAVVQGKNWRLGLFVVSGLTCVSVLGNIYLASAPKSVPYVIEVDSLGAATSRGPAAAAVTPTEQVVRYQLRRFIELTRTVSPDNVLLRRNWMDAYKMLTTTGGALMTDWYKAHDPFKRAETEIASVDIVSAVPLSASSWQIDWRETTWDRRGQQLDRPVVWRALLHTVQHAPTTPQQMNDNPFGLFINEFHWDRVQSVNAPAH